MAERGDLIAQTYRLPVPQQPEQSGRGQMGPQEFNDGLTALEGIQNVSNITSDYYKKVNQLKSFMADVHNNLGIDVRVPDMGHPESIQLNQIYTHALADIQQQGNLLKNSHGIANQQQNMQARYSSTFNPQTTPAEQGIQNEDYWTKLNPIVEQTNKFMEEAHYSGDITGAGKKYEDTKQYLESQKNGRNDDYINENIAALQPPRLTQDKIPYDFRDRQYARQINSAKVDLSEASNLEARTKGYSPTTIVSPNGGVYSQNTSVSGIRYGAKGPVVEKLLSDSKGNIMVVFKDPKEKPVPFPGALEWVKLKAAGQGTPYTLTALDEAADPYMLDNGHLDIYHKDLTPPKKEREAIIKADSAQAVKMDTTVVKPIIKTITYLADNLDTPSSWYNPMSWGNNNGVSIPIGNDKQLTLQRGKNITVAGKGGTESEKAIYSIKEADIKNLKPDTDFEVKGKVDNVAKATFYSKFQEQPLSVLVKNIFKSLPVGTDKVAILQALGLPIPDELKHTGTSATTPNKHGTTPAPSPKVTNPDI